MPDCRVCEIEEERSRPDDEYVGSFMIVCPECGNKRCPKATWHVQECSHSNDSGQQGSVYGTLPTEVAALFLPDEDTINFLNQIRNWRNDGPATGA